jgi:hypothetical protein
MPKCNEGAADTLLAEFAASHERSVDRMRRTTISLPATALRNLKRLALEADQSLNAVILCALDEFLRRANGTPLAGLKIRADDLLGRLNDER